MVSRTAHPGADHRRGAGSVPAGGVSGREPQHEPMASRARTLPLCSRTGFRRGARVNIGRNWGTPMSQKAEPELVTSGPYRLTRHPIYSGILLGTIDTSVSLAWFWLIATALAGSISSTPRPLRSVTWPDSSPTPTRPTTFDENARAYVVQATCSLTYPATLLSLVNPSLGVRELKTADRTLISHSGRGQALIGSRVFEIVARAEGRRIAGKSAPKGDSTGESQTHSSGI